MPTCKVGAKPSALVCPLISCNHLLPRLSQNLSLEAEQLSDSVLRLKISDAAKPRWEVPRWLLASQLLPGGSDGKARRPANCEATELQLEVSVKREPFSLEVTRRGQASSTLFNSTATRLVVKAR